MNSTVARTTCSPVSCLFFPRSEAVPCSPPQMLWNVVWTPEWQSGSEAESGTSLPGQPCCTRLPIRRYPPGSLTPRRRTIPSRWKSLGTKRSVATIPFVVNFFKILLNDLFVYLIYLGASDLSCSTGSLAVAHGLSCSTASGILVP